MKQKYKITIWLSFAFILVGIALPSFAAISGTGTCSSIADPLSADYSCTGNVTIDSSSQLNINGDHTLDITGDLTLSTGGDIIADPTNTYVTIQATNITLDAGTTIDTSDRGCPKSESFDTSDNDGCVDNGADAYVGFGEGQDAGGGTGGGGYGGAGGKGDVGNGGDCSGGSPCGGYSYGSAALTTIMMGSGGGIRVAAGNGIGGGAVKIVASGTLTNNGSILANGKDGGIAIDGLGGGSGGSIFISTATWAGNGDVNAEGGDGGSPGGYDDYGGGGGGGRIRIEYSTASTFSGNYSVAGGAVGGGGATAGSDGTSSVVSVVPPVAPAATISGATISGMN